MVSEKLRSSDIVDTAVLPGLFAATGLAAFFEPVRRAVRVPCECDKLWGDVGALWRSDGVPPQVLLALPEFFRHLLGELQLMLVDTPFPDGVDVLQAYQDWEDVFRHGRLRCVSAVACLLVALRRNAI